MKKHLLTIFWNPYFQAFFYFLLGLIFAFIFSKTVFSPTESVRENVPANPIMESRGL